MSRLFIRSTATFGSAESTSALSFPSNVSGSDTAAPYAVIEFSAPQSNGYPLWGVGGAGATIIMKRRFRAQTGYYNGFWWSQGDGHIDLSSGYYGFHPYPQSLNNTGTTHWWEVAINANDYVNENEEPIWPSENFSGYGHTVTYDTFYRQALRVQRIGASEKLLTFYHDLTNVISTTKSIARVTTTNYGESDPASPKVTIGDSPWYPDYQHERFSGELLGVKIIPELLSEADTITEGLDFSAMKTASGISAIWWGKNGFDSTTDLTCDYGTGRSFTKNDTSNLLSVVSV